ncbi:NAD(P)-dependent dehydrogenase (short-subunit alcohol dehydrogenase family) [Okibacterium sp. HSC-33S16]|uniref:SDR family NAD(P)-dependent oxidoreductase n=1 Tax=Okibacterium sp. HSC-33S16 TaxID=2910965 RepID=UPI00209E9339|nr:SDR family NAD(P)-dependent oxidoreductase [Okibacterium sp. HSC-33S16]MCP2030213.1 NAD(P)-dependent dehydrogenase (short-subunit alcohol dehydrogenase family) [Okibacterium sp. HSC-33S16]
MDLDLAGKVAVVTGASKGIGLAIVQALVAEDVAVVAGSRGGSAALDRAGETGAVLSVKVDLSDPSAPAQLIGRAEEFGGLDILVNNVGAVTPRTEGFLSVTDDDWLASLNLGLMTAVRSTRAAIPLLLDRGGGTVITIASVNAFLPDPGVVDYSATKAAVWNLSKALSKEYGPSHIRFNSISPGPVSTDLWLGASGVAATNAKTMGVDFETAKARVVEAQGGFTTGRFTEPSEVADLVLLLASARAGNVNGSDFLIDGGLVKTL